MSSSLSVKSLLNYPTTKLEDFSVFSKNHMIFWITWILSFLKDFFRIRKPQNPLTLVSVNLTRQKRFWDRIWHAEKVKRHNYLSEKLKGTFYYYLFTALTHFHNNWGDWVAEF